MSNIAVKICGITSSEVWEYCVEKHIAYLGLMFYAPSPRNLTIKQAQLLSSIPRGDTQSVAVCVEPDDSLLEEIALKVKPDYWQFHGKEKLKRLQEIKRRFGIPIIKSFPIAERSDFAASRDYHDIAKIFLFDAKPRPDDTLPGGNAHAFNWSLAKNAAISRPWFLAGGLRPENVGEALKNSGAQMIDLSSGVEEKRGVKSLQKIHALLQELRYLHSCRA